MITNIELTPSGAAKFNSFFADYARAGISMQAVMFEVLDILQERAIMGESLTYELGRQYTVSGNPELLMLTAADVTVTEESEEP